MTPPNIRTIQTTGSNARAASSSWRLLHAKWWRIRSRRAGGANSSPPSPPKAYSVASSDEVSSRHIPSVLRFDPVRRDATPATRFPCFSLTGGDRISRNVSGSFTPWCPCAGQGTHQQFGLGRPATDVLPHLCAMERATPSWGRNLEVHSSHPSNVARDRKLRTSSSVLPTIEHLPDRGLIVPHGSRNADYGGSK
jgi:hypothetical protein